MALVIFDLDHTLLTGDSDHAWGEFMVDQGLVDPVHYKQQNDLFYRHYQAGTLDINEYLAFTLNTLTQHPLETMLNIRERFLQERIAPLISQKSRDLIAKHKQQADTLLIITATNGFVTYPIADMLGIKHIIAPHPEMLDGKYTGRIEGIPSFHEGKVTRLMEWLEQHDQTLEGSWFYSDSRNDLPLLEIVDHPIAVNPDPYLLNIAQEKNWPIINLTDE